MDPQNNKIRICAALSTTQLLPLIHILRSEPERNSKDILLWYSYDSAVENRRLMQEIAKSYPFAATFMLEDLQMPEPRQAGPVLWPIQSLLRHRHDARIFRALLQPYLHGADRVEVWTDEPIHFPVRFLHGLFPRAIHVKVPHGFDQESEGTVGYRRRMIERAEKEATWVRKLFWYAIHAFSGVQYNLSYGFSFDRAYTFGVKSPWSGDSIDVSALINSKAMKETYAALPPSVRKEIEEKVRISSSNDGKPWALLLLFGLDTQNRERYREAIVRVYQEHPELASFHLVLKPHPLNRNEHPQILREELSNVLRRPVALFDCTMNLDVLWSVIPIKLVLAGPCGALPTIRRLGVARGIVLREILNELREIFPAEKEGCDAMIEGFEVW